MGLTDAAQMGLTKVPIDRNADPVSRVDGSMMVFVFSERNGSIASAGDAFSARSLYGTSTTFGARP